MKRIDAIIKCKGVVSEVFNRKAKRIRRAVEQIADAADDKAVEYEEKADELLNRLGDYAGSEQTAGLQDILNKWNCSIQDAKSCRESAKNFRALLKKLDEEVPEEKA